MRRPIEFYDLMMAYFAVRGLMHEAALRGDPDPALLSLIHAVRVIRRELPLIAALPPQARFAFHEIVLSEILDKRVSSSCRLGLPGDKLFDLYCEHATADQYHSEIKSEQIPPGSGRSTRPTGANGCCSGGKPRTYKA